MSKHIPVMLHESIKALDIIPNGFYIDCTFGRGGHSKEILKKLNDDGRLLALDKDLEAVKEGEKIKDLVIDKMEKALLPNLRENIIEDFYLTPDYFEKELNTKYGSGFSIQPKFTQSAYFRFHNKSEVCDGLYFVGAGTHPGAGVPGVLSSAKVLDKIL